MWNLFWTSVMLMIVGGLWGWKVKERTSHVFLSCLSLFIILAGTASVNMEMKINWLEIALVAFFFLTTVASTFCLGYFRSWLKNAVMVPVTQGAATSKKQARFGWNWFYRKFLVPAGHAFAWLYREVGVPAGRRIRAMSKWFYCYVLTPTGHFLTRFWHVAGMPTVRGIAIVGIGWGIIFSCLWWMTWRMMRFGYRHLLTPLGHLFVQLWHKMLVPTGQRARVLSCQLHVQVLVPGWKHCVTFKREKLTPQWKRLHANWCWFYVTVLTPVGHCLRWVGWTIDVLMSLFQNMPDEELARNPILSYLHRLSKNTPRHH